MRKIIGLIVMAGLCLSVASAQEKKESGLSGWLKDLQKKIEQVVPKKSIPMTTGVAGVRGAKEESQAKLYWKGKKGEAPITEEELKRFKAAVETVSKGNAEAAIKGLDEFMKQYPDSALIPDAKKTLDMVKAEGK